MKEHSILDIIKSQIKKEESLPVLSPKAAALQQEAIKPDPDFKVMIQQIQTDPTLTSQVLKAANSPYYRGLGDVETIKDAVLRLGQIEMVNIIIEAIHKQNFKSKNPFIKTYQGKLWSHSMACAMGALWTARHLKMENLVPKAFIAGLLHDMGKLYLLTALEKLLKNAKTDAKPTPELMRTIMSSLHAEQGYAILSKWNLPEGYRIIARDHHAESYDHANLLLLIVRIVNEVVNKMERSNPDEDLSSVVSSKEADILGMSEISIAQLEIALEDTMSKRLVNGG